MQNGKVKKRKPIGCFIIILFLIFLTITVAQQLSKEVEKSKIESQEDILSLEEETFSMYENVYKINNNLTKGLESVLNGSLSSVDYYDYLKEVKKYSLNQVNFIDQRTKKIKDEDVLKNLEPYSSVYTKLLMVSDNMINNLENPNLEVLSETKKLVEEVNILTVYISEERINLLKSLGIPENEIEEILKDEKEKIELEN